MQVDIEVLRTVFGTLAETFGTRDVSEDDRTRDAHPALTRHAL